MRTLHVSSARFVLLIIGVVICFAGVLGKLWWLHVKDAPKLRDEATQQRRVFNEYPASRGQILDARGALLATTREVWDVGVDAHELSEADCLRADEIAKVLHLDLGVVTRSFEKRYLPPLEEGAPPRRIKWVKLADSQDAVVAQQIRDLKIRGVYPLRRYVRYYPKGQLAAHLVGFVNREGVATSGVERAMDWFLQGQRGSLESQRDGRQRELAHLRSRKIEPRNGDNVELTIDSVLQEICEQVMEEEIARKYNPESAAIIISEPATGKILALANWPTFNLNEYNDPRKAPMEAQRNRAVTDVYEPGSVFKIIPISMGLNERLVTPNSVFDCGATKVPYRGRLLGLPKDDHPIGEADVRKIVAKSSNRGSALIAMKVTEARGEQTFYDYAYRFGFGRPTGLITGQESRGTLHRPEQWDGLTITRMPMGHAVDCTPLQMHFAMATIANGGRLMEPMLVNRVIGADGNTLLQYEPKVREQAVRPETAAQLVEMLRGVCMPGGTAAGANIPGFEVAGKTGTSQKIIDGRYSSRFHVPSFSGFFPASNPQYVISVIVNKPEMPNGRIGYGGTVCVPVFRQLAEKIIHQFGLRPLPGQAGQAI